MSGPVIFTADYYRRMRELEASSWWNAGMRDVAGHLLARTGLEDEGRLLDVGCGSGQTIAWFTTHRPGWSGVGFDVAAEGLRAATVLGETVVRASALDIPFAADTFDLALSFDVLQHLPLTGGDVRALTEIRRVLRPGGHLLVRTNAQAFPVTPDDPEYNFHKYGADELRQKLVEVDFDVIRLGRINALLGLAEIPRELSAHRTSGARYHGILAEPDARGGVLDSMKRAWLRIEGRALARGWRFPIGRTLIALCRKPRA